MTPQPISRRVLADRLAWVDTMVSEIRKLPLNDRAEFLSDSRNIFTAEPCLRRGLEALLDCGRHILAKGFAMGVSEYKEIAAQLGQKSVLAAEDAARLRVMAGYRNRLVHFYHEVSPEELFDICSTQLTDLTAVAGGFRQWIRSNADQIDDTL